MNPIFKKLNFKNHKEILILNSPESFKNNLVEISKLTNINDSIKLKTKIDFCLIFVTKKKEINLITPKLIKILGNDAPFWFAYPKGTSKNFKCDFNRDTGWEILGNYGYEGVRMVAIDEDWSALRFRKVEYIKSMTRSKKIAMSKEAKEKTKGN